MTNGWDKYDPAPIEVFHSEAIEEFHAGAQFPANEVFKDGVRFINGIEFNRLLARFKMKVCERYGISRDAIPKESEDGSSKN